MTGGNRRGSAPAILASCLALTLAACDLLQPQAAPAPPVQTAAPAAVTALPPPPPRKPTPPGQSLARLPPASAAPEAEPTEPAGSAGFDRLIGLDQPHVADLLGDPHSRAESPPATIWQYAGTDCEVDVYFYLDLQSQMMRVLHYEVRSHDLPERSVQRCYDTLTSERRPPDEFNAGSDRPR